MGDRRSFLKTALLLAVVLAWPAAARAGRPAGRGTLLLDGWILTAADLRALGDA